MRAWVLRPLREAGQRRFRMTLDERADAELGGEALRQFVLRLHRCLEVIESMLGDEHHVRHEQEAAHTLGRAMRMRHARRGEQQTNRLRIVSWQMCVQHPADLPCTFGQRQRFVSGERVAQEGRARKAVVHGHEHVRDRTRHAPNKLVLQGCGHATPV
jgi:hypothetical protein